MSDLTDRIAAELSARGLKRVDLCRGTDIIEGTIRNWIRGSSPRVEDIAKIAEFFDVSIDYLVTGKEYGEGAGHALDLYEATLIESVRKLDQRDRETVMTLIQGMLAKYASSAAADISASE